jgi:hypothetical protein
VLGPAMPCHAVPWLAVPCHYKSTFILQYHKWYYENFKIICKNYLTFTARGGTMNTLKETNATERNLQNEIFTNFSAQK